MWKEDEKRNEICVTASKKSVWENNGDEKMRMREGIGKAFGFGLERLVFLGARNGGEEELAK